MIGPVFGKEARALVAQARAAATRVGAPEVASDHLLLAIAESPTPAGRFLRDNGVAPDVVEQLAEASAGDAELLGSLGIDVGEVRESVERRYGVGTWRSAQGRRTPPFSRDAASTLRGTVAAARSTDSKRIAADELLIAVLRSGRQATALLARLGLEAAALERALRSARTV